MECPEVQELLSAWLDGELPEPLARGVEDHLQVCAACNAELELLQKLQTALLGLSAPPARDLAPLVLARLSRGRRPAVRWGASLALAACLVLGIFLGHTLTGQLYTPAADQNGSDTLALEVFQEMPQGSFSSLLAAYSLDEGNDV